MNLGKWIIIAVLVLLAYGLFCIIVWSGDFGSVDSAIGDTLTLTRAQVAYAQVNGGFNERDLSCLERRGTCIPSQQERWAGKALVDSPRSDESLPAWWARNGRHFTPGPAADPESVASRRLSPSSIRGFSYIADTSSRRPWWASVSLSNRPPLGFCGDARGHVCELMSLPLYAVTQCPADCKPLE